MYIPRNYVKEIQLKNVAQQRPKTQEKIQLFLFINSPVDKPFCSKSRAFRHEAPFCPVVPYDLSGKLIGCSCHMILQRLLRLVNSVKPILSGDLNVNFVNTLEWANYLHIKFLFWKIYGKFC